MPLISLGYNQHELDAAYQRGHAAGYSAALYTLLDEMERRLPDDPPTPRPWPVSAHDLAALIVNRLSEAQAASAEAAWLRRWEADLRANPLLEQVQRVRQELKAEQAQCARLARDLTQTQKQLREEKVAHLTAIRARDTRLTELNDLLARLTIQRLEPATADDDAGAEDGI